MHTLPSTTITIRPLAGIGCAGLPALIDRRGEPDRDGRPMQVTQVAVAELIASAAGLAMGEVDEGLPAALVSGYRFGDTHRPAADLVRPGLVSMKVTVLTGGVGGAKLVLGLLHSGQVSALTAVVNTGDDFRHMGLSVSPDIDTLLYTLSGRSNIAQGWGRAGET